jgi:hypothetical protein
MSVTGSMRRTVVGSDVTLTRMEVQVGIDCSLMTKPEAVRDAYQRYRQLLEKRRDAGVDVVHDPLVTQCSQELRDLERQYHTAFSASWAGWRHFLTAMHERGMLANVAPAPQPDLAAHGYDGPCAVEVLIDPAAPKVVRDLVAAWLEQAPGQPGIAIFKLLSNDFWIVTSDEARSALEILGSQPAPNLPGWEGWIAFLRQAIDHDGFHVT